MIMLNSKGNEMYYFISWKIQSFFFAGAKLWQSCTAEWFYIVPAKLACDQQFVGTYCQQDEWSTPIVLPMQVWVG